MLKCNNCGKVIDDDDLGYHTEPHGEILPNECFCGGDYEEAFACKCCGDYFLEEELTNGYCNECLESEMTYDNAIKCGSENEESVAINGFIASCFDSSEIEEILLKELTQAKELMLSRINEYVKTYCKDDLDYFAEWLEEQE